MEGHSYAAPQRLRPSARSFPLVPLRGWWGTNIDINMLGRRTRIFHSAFVQSVAFVKKRTLKGIHVPGFLWQHANYGSNFSGVQSPSLPSHTDVCRRSLGGPMKNGGFTSTLAVRKEGRGDERREREGEQEWDEAWATSAISLQQQERWHERKGDEGVIEREKIKGEKWKDRGNKDDIEKERHTWATAGLAWRYSNEWCVLTHTFCISRDPLQLSIGAHQFIAAPFFKLPREYTLYSVRPRQHRLSMYFCHWNNLFEWQGLLRESNIRGISLGALLQAYFYLIHKGP